MASPRTLRDLSLRPVSVLKTVSDRKAAQLELWGIESVLDLLMTFPRKDRYIDRTAKASVSGLDVGTAAAVLAEVVRVRGGGGGRGGGYNRNRKVPVTVVVRDETGTMEIVFFNQPWRAKQLREGTEAIFWGKVGDYRGTRQMVNPVVDVVAGVDDDVVGRQRRTLRILPVYPASAKAGLTSWEIGTFVEEALERAGEFLDPLAGDWLTSLGLWGRTEAMQAIHKPESIDVIGPARRRLTFDELFRLQLALVLRRRAFEHNARALRHDVSPREITGAVGGTLVARIPRRAAVRADDGPAARAGGYRGRSGRSVPHAPPAPGRRRVGEDGGGVGGAARSGPERASRGAHGAHRGAGRAARGGRPPDARRRSTSAWSC